MSFLESEFKRRRTIICDINEHLDTLYKYAKECAHITECGVNDVNSSYAFAYGLLGKPTAKLIQVDPYKSDYLNEFNDICDMYNIQTVFYHDSDLTCPVEKTDLLFIDTWHIYGQLKRELARWHSYAAKYIILHDTEVDGIYGESLRVNSNIKKQSLESGMPEEEIAKGLMPAIDEFLQEHPEWVLEEQFTNNNGLTVLKRNIN
jgi:hypothetical protein